MASWAQIPFCDDIKFRNSKNTPYSDGYINGVTVNGDTIYVPTGVENAGGLTISNNGAGGEFNTINIPIDDGSGGSSSPGITKVVVRGNLLYALIFYGGYLKVSYDRGKTWSNAQEGTGPGNSADLTFITDLKVDPVTNNVYAIQNLNGEGGALFVSTDGIYFHENQAFKNAIGITLSAVVPSHLAVVDNLVVVSAYLSTLDPFNPMGPRIISRYGFLISTDGGNTFDIADVLEPTYSKIKTLYIDPSNKEIYFTLDTDVSSFRRTNLARKNGDVLFFDSVNIGVSDNYSNRITTLYAQGNTIYVGTSEGLGVSTDGGNSFEGIVDFKGVNIGSITVANGRLYVAYQGDEGGYGGIGYGTCSDHAIEIKNFSATPNRVIVGQPISFTATMTTDGSTYNQPYQAILSNGQGSENNRMSQGESTYTQTLTAQGSGPQTYTLTINNGAITTATVSVTVVPPPPTLTDFRAKIGGAYQNNVVEFDATVGEVTGDYNYTLTNGRSVHDTGSQHGKFIDIVGIRDTGPQTFTLTVSTSNGTASATLSLTVLPITITDFSASPNPVRAGQSVNFTARLNSGEGDYAYTYTLSNGGDSKVVSTGNNPQFKQTLTAQGSGLQTYTLTVTTLDITVTATVSVAVVPPPTLTNFTATPNPIAAGRQIDFKATLVGLTDTYSLTLTNGSGTPFIDAHSLGSYQNETAIILGDFAQGSGPQTYTLTVATPGGTATATTSITVVAPLRLTNFAATPNPVVVGQPVEFTATVGGGTGTYNYQFYKENDSRPLMGTASGPTFKHTLIAEGSGSQTYVLKVYMGPEDVVMTTVAVTVLPPPPLTLTDFTAAPNPVVAGQSVEFTATLNGLSDTEPYSYTLTNGQGSAIVDTASGANFKQSLPAQGTGPQTYTLTIGGDDLHDPVTATTSVTVVPFAITGLKVYPNPVQSGQSVEFTATLNGLGDTEPYSYTLTNGQQPVPVTGDFSGSFFQESLTAQGIGPQTYTLTVTTPSKGTATATVAVTVTVGSILLDRFAITGVTALNCALTDPARQEYQVRFTPLYAGANSNPVSFSVVNEMLPTTAPPPYQLRLYADNPAITLVANQAGNPEARYTYNWLAACRSLTPGSFAISGLSPVVCQTVTANERRLTMTPQYTGLDGSPVNFSVVNEMLPTTAPPPYQLRLYIDNPVITLVARQGNTQVQFIYNWLAGCGATGARLGTGEPGNGLQVKVLGNPIYTNQVVVEVRGAAGQLLRLSLTDLQGRTVSERQVEQASEIETQTLLLSSSPASMLLLRVSTPSQTETIKVLSNK